VVEPELVLGGLERVLDRPAPALDTDQHLERGTGLALQLQGSLEVSPLRHGLMASPPDGPRDDECRLDPALG